MTWLPHRKPRGRFIRNCNQRNVNCVDSMLCLLGKKREGCFFLFLLINEIHIFASHCDWDGSLCTVEKLKPTLSMYFATRMLKYFLIFISLSPLCDVYGFSVWNRMKIRGAWQVLLWAYVQVHTVFRFVLMTVQWIKLITGRVFFLSLHWQILIFLF